MNTECANLLSFLSGELGEKEKKAFTEHLMHCSECTREYEQMTEAWNSLKWDFEEMEPSSSLKSEVMDFVFETDDEVPVGREKNWSSFFFKQFTPVTSGLLLAALVLAFVLLYSNIQLKKELAAINLPMEVKTSLSLQPADKTAVNMSTDGAAYILQQGEERRLIVQIQNLPSLQKSEVYQVWLLKDGKRTNAGTFKPDEAGTGSLTYKLSINDKFNQIGITREPDANSTKPRGEKIVGSS
ncbi:putative zinc finger protein [Peribacillus frigoritolerans]|uniref:anti-sigma factor n=1 Tax=Peribacillus frigoritolerans TaxID=450367 RepID=UPI00119BF4B3|nr:anti-sigma factor [Peribacillus frigoritolerans]TWD99719.1 putative zinc finger protein [Peribacillus frigoritolerans]